MGSKNKEIQWFWSENDIKAHKTCPIFTIYKYDIFVKLTIFIAYITCKFTFRQG